MTNESDPNKGVVDIDTFNLWLEDYKTGLINNSSNRRIRPSANNFLKKVFSDRPNFPSVIPSVILEGCLCSELPESIQEVVGKVYDSTYDGINGALNINFTNKSVNLEAIFSNTLSTGLNLDLAREEYIGGISLILSGGGKGKWSFSKIPYALFEKGSKLFDDPEQGPDVLKAVRSFRQEIPATLDQLLDMVRFLEKSQDKAVVDIFYNP